ncbi:hypothetical protein HF086_009947 [Spodoptera exigua]|uniref:Uncharacterized protein n=1 Tax=Spodoptera exigua TaxID=7107 RepID=A0A922M4P4_SPOEX|nr:hypothetical protein HF086_009947 [Spodoptera exigua]
MVEFVNHIARKEGHNLEQLMVTLTVKDQKDAAQPHERIRFEQPGCSWKLAYKVILMRPKLGTSGEQLFGRKSFHNF